MLSLSGTPKTAISGTDASDFSVTSQPAATVAASGNTTFTIRFAPSTGGAKNATITIANNDSDEGTYTFAVTGTASASPEINIKQGSTNLASGSGSQTFGSAVANSGTADLTFTIENTGSATLNITGTPKAALSGANAAEFSVTAQPAATVAASGTTTFTIRFAPTSAAAKTATVTVANDDSDEGTYTFTITGTGTVAPVTANYIARNPALYNQTNSSPATIQDWSNITNAGAADGSMTSAVIDEVKTQTSRLDLSSFGFPWRVPSSGTVSGIQVEILRSASNMTNSATCRDLSVKLIYIGSVTGNNLAATSVDWPSVPAYATYGGPTNTWGLTPSLAFIDASDLGIAIEATANLPNATGSCTANIDSVRITLYYVPGDYRVFTTQWNHDGNIGGLAGADAMCQSVASTASVRGVWKALLSDEITNAKDRLTFVSGVLIKMLSSSSLVANDGDDLWTGGSHDYLSYDPAGVYTGAGYAWTGTNTDGTKSAGNTCNSWTSSSGSDNGLSGKPNTAATTAINHSSLACSTSNSIICVNQ